MRHREERNGEAGSTSVASSLAAALVIVGAAIAACGGHLSLGQDGPAEEAGPGPGPGDASAVDGGAPSDLYGGDPGAGVVGVRRLTFAEYNHTIRDLLGDVSNSANASVFGADALGVSGFREGAVVGDSDVEGLIALAERFATEAVQDPTRLLPGVPVPTAAADQPAWAQRFIATFGRRAYRRPLLPEEQADLLALYQSELAPPLSGDFPSGIRLVVSAMLQSPSFLYRWELGPQPALVAQTADGTRIRYNQYELASRLSYLLWASMPDDTLLDAAAAGRLHSIADVQAQARRMLSDSKAIDGMTEFVTQWLELDVLPQLEKDPAVYPQFSPALAASMLGETARFAWAVLGPNGDGRLATLLTASSTFVDPNLAALYGLGGDAG